MRGIVAGDAFRRMVGKVLARQYAKEFDQATAPFQFALSTRAGTDALGLLLRGVTDADPEAVVVSLDGIGAFDHLSVSASEGFTIRDQGSFVLWRPNTTQTDHIFPGPAKGGS